MLVAIGSTNPVKVSAVKAAIDKVKQKLDDKQVIEYLIIDAPSGVRAMPLSNEEALEGALNRARYCVEQCRADLGIGLEGGVQTYRHGMMLSGFAVVIDQKGRISAGSGPGPMLPELVAKKIRAGAELGPIMDQHLGVKNLKTDIGTIGVLTHGLITREESFMQAVLCAVTSYAKPLGGKDKNVPASFKYNF